MLKKLIDIVNKSYEVVSKRIQEDNNLVFTEADFERLLTNEIEQLIIVDEQLCRSYTVHNQVSHYSAENRENPILDYRVDILIMENSKIKVCQEVHKSFIYESSEDLPSVAIELKYYRPDDSVRTIVDDLDKLNSLANNNSSHLYVVALTSNSSQKEQIESIFSQHRKDERLTTRVFAKNGRSRKSD